MRKMIFRLKKEKKSVRIYKFFVPAPMSVCFSAAATVFSLLVFLLPGALRRPQETRAKMDRRNL